MAFDVPTPDDFMTAKLENRPDTEYDLEMILKSPNHVEITINPK